MALSFDANYYLSARPDVFHAFVATAGATGKTWAEFAEEHYNTFGRFEGANPNAIFNTDEYLAANPDVAAAGVNPFTHYLHFGAAEGRAPSDSFPSFASFDSAAYLAANPDLGAADIDTAEEAYAHFVIFGQFEDRPGAPAVDNGLPGEEIKLTVGPDDRTGTKGNDTFNALPIDANGNAASTLTAFDKLDGGAGVDTLNIYTTATENAAFPANASIKNIEIVNIHNSAAAAALGDASKYEGVTALNQIGANAANVTNLAATTTAGFNGTAGGALSVQAAAAAATATVALTNVAEAATLDVSAAAGGVLNSVKVSGTRVETTPGTPAAPLTLSVTAGKDVESLALDVAVNSTLTLSNEAGSTKALSTVDASASTGSLAYVGAGTVANIKTGSGNDAVTLATAMTATSKAASVSTGAGNDVIDVNATAAAAGATVAVDAGEGNDTINLSIDANANFDVKAGAGDDTVVITGTVKTTDKIDGGDGIDTVSLASKTAYVADDYIVVNKVLTNFETLKLTGVAIAGLDASKLAANYTTIDLSAGSSVVNVGTQALVANGDLTATASGTDVSGATKVYAGSLNITEKATGTITANAATVDLTVDASAAAVTATLEGFAQSANVNLLQALNAAGTGFVGAAEFKLTTAAGVQDDLTTLTLSGNGIATIDNAAGKLITIDASGLNSVTFDGKAAAGLNYTSSNAAAESIKLGAGIDLIKLTASTVGATDTVEGLNLVLDAGGALDATSDNIDLAAVATFKKFTTSHTDLDLALKDAAALADDDLVFQLGGNTYIYQDSVGAGLVDSNDVLVKLTGLVDLDALIVALA